MTAMTCCEQNSNVEYSHDGKSVDEAMKNMKFFENKVKPLLHKRT
jgi:hypothetical protein